MWPEIWISFPELSAPKDSTRGWIESTRSLEAESKLIQSLFWKVKFGWGEDVGDNQQSQKNDGGYVLSNTEIRSGGKGSWQTCIKENTEGAQKTTNGATKACWTNWRCRKSGSLVWCRGEGENAGGR